ncbi:MAG: IPT/TIG domain-containing protein [Acidobacteriia bacterium]|nr:IPT/TIG domain-containing protein [Terriglobia bacterium]
MFPVWDCRHSLGVRLSLLLMACGGAIACGSAIAAAQDVPAQRVQVPRAIILPSAVVAGAQATLAVVDGAGRLVSGVAVEISGGAGTGAAGSPSEKVTTDSTGRATFLPPSGPGPLIAKIAGRKIAASSAVVSDKETLVPAGAAADASSLKVTSYPHVLAILDRFAIEGRGFRGTADSNHVFLGEQPCLVVASSPVSLVILPGLHIALGSITLRVRAGGSETGPMPVTGVLLDFSGPAEVPTAGAEGKLILRVHGTTDPLDVEVRNASPEIIQLLHGNLQRVGTSGGEQNIAPVEMKFLASGNYVVTARLVPADTPNPHGAN